MTAERADAYGRIMRALSNRFGRHSTGHEVARIRQACDMLVLAHSESPEDRHAMTDAIVALADLVDRGDISKQQASAMVDDIGLCAPARTADDEAITR